MVEKSEGLRKGGVGEWAERGGMKGGNVFSVLFYILIKTCIYKYKDKIKIC